VKIEPRQAAAFLKNPGKNRAVLLYGDDEGLIRERGAALTKLVAGSLTDPFQVVDLDRGGWPRLADEMTAISMMGGRRVVRVREVTDAVLDGVKSALKTAGDALVVLEAPELGKGKLRSFMEAGHDVAALACYAEDAAALQETIRKSLAESGVSADGEALAWLAEALAGSRAALRAELEKLCLLAGAGGRIDLDLARQSAGDTASATADSGLLAATLGDLPACETALDRAMAEGLAGVALIRMALGHLQKLHQARLRMANGMSASDALRAQRPPVFFKLMGSMATSLQLWPADLLARAIEEARQVEIACKQTGARQELLARRFVSALARQSYLRAQRR
jgi:DNA polymerase III subunit delta